MSILSCYAFEWPQITRPFDNLWDYFCTLWLWHWLQFVLFVSNFVTLYMTVSIDWAIVPLSVAKINFFFYTTAGIEMMLQGTLGWTQPQDTGDGQSGVWTLALKTLACCVAPVLHLLSVVFTEQSHAERFPVSRWISAHRLPTRTKPTMTAMVFKLFSSNFHRKYVICSWACLILLRFNHSECV